MQRVKKKKQKGRKLDTHTVIRMTNYLNLACLVTALWDCNTIEDKETRREDVLKVVEAYKIYLTEVADKRQTVWGAVKACEELANIDVVSMIDEVFNNE